MSDLLFKASGGLYKYKSKTKIDDGAYSSIYDVSKLTKDNKTKKGGKNIEYIVKVQKIEDKDEAINEIKILTKIKKNKEKYYNSLTKYYNTLTPYLQTSKIIDIVDYFIDYEYIYVILEKYEYTLYDFNILYNREFKTTIPINLCRKIINSIFLGLYELNVSGIMHCDLKPNNILLVTTKSLKTLFNDIKKKKIKHDDLINYLDIKIIDFNLSQKSNSIYKSTTIQTIYYMAPEIILDNYEFNNTVDIWSIGVIIFELVTGRYLFDIYDNNKKYDLNFENYEIVSKKIKRSDDSSEEESSEESSDDYNDINNLALLHYYRDILGDNSYIKGKRVEKYYLNQKLYGTIFINTKSRLDDLYYYYLDLKCIKKDNIFYKEILILLENIFQYNINKRLSLEDYLTKYKIYI